MNITINHIVRILIYEIRDKNPEAVKFIVSANEVETISKNLIEKKYDVLIKLYGKDFVNGILKMHEEYENFEECSIIINKIKNK